MKISKKKILFMPNNFLNSFKNKILTSKQILKIYISIMTKILQKLNKKCNICCIQYKVIKIQKFRYNKQKKKNRLMKFLGRIFLNKLIKILTIIKSLSN